MNCPSCQIAYDPDHWEACPHCGAGSRKEAPVIKFSGVVRTSAVLIAAGDSEPEVYRSLDEVPEPLRRLLISSTSGINSGTIFIADQGGRELMTRALRGFPEASSLPLMPRLPAGMNLDAQGGAKRMVPLSALWVALVVATLSGAGLWVAASRSW